MPCATAPAYSICAHDQAQMTGPDALNFLNRMLIRDVSKSKPARVTYSISCDDDGDVFHVLENEPLLCSQERQPDWMPGQ